MINLIVIVACVTFCCELRCYLEQNKVGGRSVVFLYCFVQAAPSQKLPALYLIDSIIKNVSDSNYLALFTGNIVATFTFVFEKVSSVSYSNEHF